MRDCGWISERNVDYECSVVSQIRKAKVGASSLAVLFVITEERVLVLIDEVLCLLIVV